MPLHTYIGRFAPSPTGPLHFGSLIAATASYCDAKANAGKWLLRMEDVDKPREKAGAAEHIIETLQAFGFEWDGNIIRQSQRQQVYQDALAKLQAAGLVYPCTCSRKEIADSNPAHGIEGVIYPRTCLQHPPRADKIAALRLKVNADEVGFTDAIQSEITQHLSQDIGDFVIKRADGLFAYQLAVVVDDAEQGITHVVRGADLLDSTPRQIYLQQQLGLPTPRYAHIPVITNANGEKLSKQTLAQAIAPQYASITLWRALDFLGQNPPKILKDASVQAIWEWAFTNWDMQSIPRRRSINDNFDALKPSP